MSGKLNKKDRKKICVMILLLFAIVGIAGYGVYSYYWTQGTYSGSDSISITSFNPETTISDDSDFLGHGGSVILTCPDSITTTGKGTTTCTGSLVVANKGGTDITVEVLNAGSGTYNQSGLEATPDTPNFGWTSATLQPGESKSLSVSVDVSFTSDFGSDSPVEREYDAFSSTPNTVYSDHSQILVNFKLKATQVHQ